MTNEQNQTKSSGERDFFSMTLFRERTGRREQNRVDYALTPEQCQAIMMLVEAIQEPQTAAHRFAMLNTLNWFPCNSLTPQSTIALLRTAAGHLLEWVCRAQSTFRVAPPDETV